MIVVLIHWRIQDTDEAELQFLKWWKNEASIEDKAGLVGEFLSAPLPADQFCFRVDDLAPNAAETAYRPFVNVGYWKDWESFYDQVGRHIDDKRKEEFEAGPRSRTILEPKEWRMGEGQLPEEGTCE